MGRSAGGVRGIKLKDDQKVISLIIAQEGSVLTTTEHGYGKRTAMDGYPRHGRGGQGVIAIQTTDRNGSVVGAELVQSDDEMMLITSGGTLVRTKVEEVSVMGRNTQGVRLIRLGKGEQLTGMARVASIKTEDESETEESSDSGSSDNSPSDNSPSDNTTSDETDSDNTES